MPSRPGGQPNQPDPERHRFQSRSRLFSTKTHTETLMDTSRGKARCFLHRPAPVHNTHSIDDHNRSPPCIIHISRPIPSKSFTFHRKPPRLGHLTRNRPRQPTHVRTPTPNPNTPTPSHRPRHTILRVTFIQHAICRISFRIAKPSRVWPA
jgi:hypothetical protein